MSPAPPSQPTDSPRENASGLAGEGHRRLPVEPLEPAITSIQPGGGVCMRLELLWGHVRRAVLKTCFSGYVERMRQLRQGTPGGCPHEVLDPRDLKYYQNQGGYWWRASDDPLAWRDRLPLVRAGLGEVVIFGMACGLAAALVSWWSAWLAIAPAVVFLWVLWFFRNPRRIAPDDPGLVIAPADGLVVGVQEIDHDPFLGGPAVEIGIFLSIFDVHVNRAPVAARVIGLTYRPGKFLNALLPASARENERVTVRLEEAAPPHRRFVVRQIAGAIARRIVCWMPPGAELPRGGMFGMIKLGSRTELVLQREAGLKLLVKKGDRVRAGETVVASYKVLRSN